MAASLNHDRWFSQSYPAARDRLLRAAAALGVETLATQIPGRGPTSEALYQDWIQIGDPNPTDVFVLSSGTHGAEGLTGSAIQLALLQLTLPTLQLPAGTAIVLQHANNPYAFAWERRVDEQHVDLNRNFAPVYDPTLCDPLYEELYDLLNPTDLDAAHEQQRWQQIHAVIERDGLRRFQQGAIGGQYKFADGLQFGGHAPTAAHQGLVARVQQQLSQARRVLWLDIHTGLGPFGACEILNGFAVDTDEQRLANEVWQGQVKSAADNQSVSTPLNGLLDVGLRRVLPADCRFGFAYAEYGTLDPLSVIAAIRADHWLHRHGDPFDATGRRIRAQMREAFMPTQHPDASAWRQAIIRQGLGFAQRALQALGLSA